MAEALVGRTLHQGEYELRGILGRGGMATVYRGYSRPLEAEVAIKVLSPRLAGDPGFRERFHDEARRLANLHHPNLVEVHSYGEEADLVYIVMRLVAGGTLEGRLAAIGAPLDLLTVARVVGQVAGALQLAHDRQLVHLDIKPANVLLGRADWPLLADFGITQAVVREPTGSGSSRVAGTPLYMSPEQCRGGAVDGRSDQYSLAVMTYELLTGQRPFVAPTTEAILRRHVEDPPPRVREANPGVPAPVEAVLLRALARAPEERYPTVREFAEDLTAAVERTRGVALETKAAVAEAAPNMLAALTLVVLGPLILGILPADGTIAGQVPLAWPFQLVLATLIAGCLLGVRWHLIGLITRGLRRCLAALDWTERPGPSRRQAARSQPGGWRNAVAATVENGVNLLYLLGIYRLLAVPLLGILRAAAGDVPAQAAGVALIGLVAVLALVLVIRALATVGPVGAALLLACAGAAVEALPTTALLPLFPGLDSSGGLKAGLGLVVLVALLVFRSRTQRDVRHVAAAGVGRLLVDVMPGATPEAIAAGRQRLEALAGAVADCLYLLAGYALLRSPLLELLRPFAGPLPAAIAVSGAAGTLWLLLGARLWLVARTPGLALAVLLGAPLLLSLPLLDASVLSIAWPAAGAAWGVGTVLVVLLASIRSQVQAVSQAAVGARLDREILGTAPVVDEATWGRRIGAFGRLGGAFVDVGYLIVGYWALGVPAARALATASNRSEAGTLLLAGLLLAALGVLAGPTLAVAGVLLESNPARWSTSNRTLPGLVAILAALLVAGCAAVPAAVVAPEVAGGLALAPARSAGLVVEWEHWVPWSPSPEQATYNLALACADGRQIGEFREAFRPEPEAPMPFGAVGSLGPTGVSCDDWQSVYLARRQAAGLPAEPTFSWDWLDVRATINPDQTVDVVETHRVLFTSGSHDHLAWDEGAIAETGHLSDVAVSEGGIRFSLEGESGDGAETSSRRARVWEENGRQIVGWWFPAVASPDVRTYVVTYRLSDALQPTGSWTFTRRVLSPDRQQPVWRTTVEIRLAEGFGPGAIELSSAGTAPATDGLLDDRTAWFGSSDAPADADLTITVRFHDEAAAASEETVPTATPVLVPTGTRGPADLPTATRTPRPTNTPRPAPIPTRLAPPTPRPATPTALVLPSATAVPPPEPTDTPPPAAATRVRPAPTAPPLPVPTPVPTLTPTQTPVARIADVTSTPSATPPAATPTLTPMPPTPSWTATPGVTPVPPTPTFTRTLTPVVAPPTATFTRTPTSTPCPKLTNVGLSAAAPGSDNRVTLTWTSAGGCGPFTGTITARYSDQPAPYRTYSLSAPSGSVVDLPPSRCEGNFNVTYTLILRD